ncbi:MAG: hypothetical protein ABIK37_05200 [candidate division WOR-3 bacterium]
MAGDTLAIDDATEEIRAIQRLLDTLDRTIARVRSGNGNGTDGQQSRATVEADDQRD